MELDHKDRKLIALLRQNARLPISSLAIHLEVSRATVQNRITRLTDSGVIQGFSVRLKADADTLRIRAITLIQARARQTKEVINILAGLPHIRALHSTNGSWDIIAELSTENLEEFDGALNFIQNIEGVAKTETNLLLTSYKM
jgi:DNA-binding Lrp family transcriptional regulator